MIEHIEIVPVGRIPRRIVEKAEAIMEGREPKYLRKISTGHVVRVGGRHRMFRKFGETAFQLMTHERYNHVYH